MVKVTIIKEFVDASDFNKRYEVGKEAQFEEERAKRLSARGLVSMEEQKDVKNPDDVSTLAEAKAFLNYKEIAIANNAGLEKVIETAKQNGIEFPKLNIEK